MIIKQYSLYFKRTVKIYWPNFWSSACTFPEHICFVVTYIRLENSSGTESCWFHGGYHSTVALLGCRRFFSNWEKFCLLGSSSYLSGILLSRLAQGLEVPTPTLPPMTISLTFDKNRSAMLCALSFLSSGLYNSASVGCSIPNHLR